MGYPPGSVLELLFGDKAYVGVEGAAHRVDRRRRRSSPSPTTGTGSRSANSPSTEWFAGVQTRAPEVLGTDIDMGAYLQFMADMPVGVHWPIVHRARALKASGTPIALLTNNVAEWGDHWRVDLPGRRAVRDRRRFLGTCRCASPTPRSTCSPASGSASRRTRACSSTTTPTTWPRRARSAWRRCTSARTRSSRSPSSTRSSTRRGTVLTADALVVRARQAPAIVMSATSRVSPAVPPGSHVRSEPIAEHVVQHPLAASTRP